MNPTRNAFLLATVLALAGAPAHAQNSPPKFRAEVRSTAATADADILSEDLTVYAPTNSSAIPGLTTFAATVSFVGTDSKIKLVRTDSTPTEVVEVLYTGTTNNTITAGDSILVTWVGTSNQSYNLRTSETTTIGTLVVFEVPNATFASRRPSSSGGGGSGDLTEVTVTGDAITVTSGTGPIPDLAAAADLENLVDNWAIDSSGNATSVDSIAAVGTISTTGGETALAHSTAEVAMVSSAIDLAAGGYLTITADTDADLTVDLDSLPPAGTVRSCVVEITSTSGGNFTLLANGAAIPKSCGSIPTTISAGGVLRVEIEAHGTNTSGLRVVGTEYTEN